MAPHLVGRFRTEAPEDVPQNTPDSNRIVFDRVAPDYETFALQRPEQRLLGLFRGRWGEIDMLDLGVGAGRTAYTFAPLVRSYVGIDYAPRMVALARRSIEQTDRVRCEQGDARDLSRFPDGSFDLVLFSYNGIDYVEHEDRLEIFRQIRRKLREDGMFVFSSHSTTALPLPLPLPPRSWNPLRWAYRWYVALPAVLRTLRTNLRLDRASVRRSGWTLVQDEAHGGALRTYYVHPREQVRQLRACGFRVQCVLDTEGAEVDLASPPASPWLYYLSEPNVASDREMPHAARFVRGAAD
jgi:SAM-dependent methyltransferase